MAAKALFALSALLVQGITGQCIRSDLGAAAAIASNRFHSPSFDRRPLSSVATSGRWPSGGEFIVTSSSPLAPSGMTVSSEARIEGPLRLAGQLPLWAAVALEGRVPTAGGVWVAHQCGEAVGIDGVSEAADTSYVTTVGYGAPLAPATLVTTPRFTALLEAAPLDAATVAVASLATAPLSASCIASPAASGTGNFWMDDTAAAQLDGWSRAVAADYVATPLTIAPQATILEAGLPVAAPAGYSIDFAQQATNCAAVPVTGYFAAPRDTLAVATAQTAGWSDVTNDYVAAPLVSWAAAPTADYFAVPQDAVSTVNCDCDRFY